MKLIKIEPGRYESEDGRVVIKRCVSLEWSRRLRRNIKETTWTIRVDGKDTGYGYETLSDAKWEAERSFK